MTQEAQPPASMTAADFLELLEADIANIIALVTAGQPLSKAQRSTLEEYYRKAAAKAQTTPAGDPPAPPATMATPGASPPATLEAPADAPEPVADPAGDPEPLEEPLPPGSYRHPQSVYASRYGYSVRAVKGWLAAGRAAGKLAPLDDPEALLTWWHAVMRNRPSSRILAAAENAKAARMKREALAPRPPAPPPTMPEAPPPPPAVPLEVGFAASLARVREAEAQANVAYLAERAKSPDLDPLAGGRDDAKLSRLRREWSELSEQLRFLEKAAPEVLAKSGEIYTKVEIRRLLGAIHGPIVSGVRSLFRRTRQKLGAAAAADDTAGADPSAPPEPARLAAHLEALAAMGATPEQAVDALRGRRKLLDELEALYAGEVERLFRDLLASAFAPP